MKSKTFRDNWDRVFGGGERKAECDHAFVRSETAVAWDCVKCGLRIGDADLHRHPDLLGVVDKAQAAG